MHPVLSAWLGFVFGAALVWALGLLLERNSEQEKKSSDTIDKAVMPGYLKLADDLRKELKDTTTKFVPSKFADTYLCALGIRGAGEDITVQQQLDKLYAHLGLELKYEEGKEAAVVLGKTKKK